MRASETKLLVPVGWCCQSCHLINTEKIEFQFCLSQSARVKIGRILMFKSRKKSKHTPVT